VVGVGLGDKHDSPVRSLFSGDRVLAGASCSDKDSNHEGVSADLFQQVEQETGCDTGGVTSSKSIIGGGQKTSFVFSEVEESTINFIPSYRDVLSWTPL
jgi:hypothetical protein